MGTQSPFVQAVVDDWLAGKMFKAMLVQSPPASTIALAADLDELDPSIAGYIQGGESVTLTTAVVSTPAGAAVTISMSAVAWPNLVVNTLFGLAIYAVETDAVIGADIFGPISIGAGQGLEYESGPEGFVKFEYPV